MTKPEDFFSEQEEQEIVATIRKAETNTSGEIRLHVEATTKGDPLDRAVELFYQLKMDKTELDNGVLFYLAYESKKYAIIGDKGIDEAVGHDFWESIHQGMNAHFKEGRFAKGLMEGITLTGEKLKAYYPYDAEGDVNELPDDISFGSK